MSKELYINGVMADMDDKTDVNISYKSPLFSDLQAMAANTTLTIKLPKTAHNRAIIDSAVSTGVQSDWPYKHFRADIVEDGFEIIHNGIGYIITASENIELSIIFGGIASFATIKDAKLPMLPVTIADGYIDWNSSSKWVGFGQVADIMFLRADFGQNKLHPDEMKYAHPCVKVTKIVEWINQSYALKLEPTLGQRLAVPCVTKNARETARSMVILPQLFNYGVGLIISGFDMARYPIKLLDSTYNIFYATSDYRFKFYDDGEISFIGNYTFSDNDQGQGMGSKSKCIVEIREYSGNNIIAVNVLEESSSIPVLKDIEYGIMFVFDTAHYGKYLRSMACEVKPVGDEIMFGEKFDTINNLPDIKVVDFIKAIMQIEGAFPMLTPTGIKSVSVDDVYANIPQAIDWSGKLLSHKATSFRFGSFGQQNMFKWAEDETVPANTSIPGVIYVDNTTIEPTYDCVKLPFAACETSNGGEAYIPLYVNEAKKGEAEQIEFQSVKSRIVEIAAMPGGHPHAGAISMSSIVEQAYESYQRVIRRPRVEKCTFRLSPRDVAELDLTMPIYVEQLGAHYAIMNLMVKENETEAELLQL